MEKDYNDLPTEIKILIVNAKTLVNETREAVKTQTNILDLTCRLQLRDDCKLVEKSVKRLERSKSLQTDVANLEQAMIRLRTSSNGILHMA